MTVILHILIPVRLKADTHDRSHVATSTLSDQWMEEHSTETRLSKRNQLLCHWLVCYCRSVQSYREPDEESMKKLAKIYYPPLWGLLPMHRCNPMKTQRSFPREPTYGSDASGFGAERSIVGIRFAESSTKSIEDFVVQHILTGFIGSLLSYTHTRHGPAASWGQLSSRVSFAVLYPERRVFAVPNRDRTYQSNRGRTVEITLVTTTV